MISWHVSVNNNQYIYIVKAATAGGACIIAGHRWRNDSRLTAKQRHIGIYAIRARHAKFSEIDS